MNAEALHTKEAKLFHGSPNGPPNYGIALSGGGNRSAAFCVGVLKRLHERKLLQKADIISAVSGGSYALSWLLLQPYYYKKFRDKAASLEDIYEKMFDLDGDFQEYLEDHAHSIGTLATPFGDTDEERERVRDKNLKRIFWLFIIWGAVSDAIVLNLTDKIRSLFSPNDPSFHTLSMRSYARSLQITYQFLPGEQQNPEFYIMRNPILPQLSISPVSFPEISQFARNEGLASFVICATIRLPLLRLRPLRFRYSADLRDKVFELTPAGFGSDSCGFFAWEQTDNRGLEPEDRPTRHHKPKKSFRDRWHEHQPHSPFAAIRNFNLASAISGSALSASTSRRLHERLFLTLLNLGLGYSIRHPEVHFPWYRLRLGDGGHSENLGAYSLLRRGCRNTLIVDAVEEKDPNKFEFAAYHELKKNVERDLKINLEIPDIDDGSFSADQPVCCGRATRSGHPDIKIHYVKLSMDENLLGEHTGTIMSYAADHDTFPHESTLYQYFSKARFKAYRALGYQVADSLPQVLWN